MPNGIAQALGATLLASCGAIMAPGPFPVPVDSRPPGATVVYEGREVGATPCVVAMRRSSHAFEIYLDGYHPRHVDVGATRNHWVTGNLVTLGFGMLIDGWTGADKNPDADPVLVHLAPQSCPRPAAWARWRWVTRPTSPSPQGGASELLDGQKYRALGNAQPYWFRRWR